MRQRQELRQWMALQPLTPEQMLQLQMTSSILMNPIVNSATTQFMGPVTMALHNAGGSTETSALSSAVAAGLPMVLHPESTTRNSASNAVSKAPPAAASMGTSEIALGPVVPAPTNDLESLRLAYERAVGSAGIPTVNHVESLRVAYHSTVNSERSSDPAITDASSASNLLPLSSIAPLVSAAAAAIAAGND
jgi:hypothetical protein